MIKAIKMSSLLVGFLALSACGIFGGDDKKSAEAFDTRVTAMGVNGFLWQATLDTLSFMPIDQANQDSGVIITGWHSTPQATDERVKVTVQFLSTTLRSDGIKVAVVRQERMDGLWVTAPVQASTALQVEEAILTQARMLKSRPVE